MALLPWSLQFYAESLKINSLSGKCYKNQKYRIKSDFFFIGVQGKGF